MAGLQLRLYDVVEASLHVHVMLQEFVAAFALLGSGLINCSLFASSSVSIALVGTGSISLACPDMVWHHLHAVSDLADLALAAPLI